MYLSLGWLTFHLLFVPWYVTTFHEFVCLLHRSEYCLLLYSMEVIVAGEQSLDLSAGSVWMFLCNVCVVELLSQESEEYWICFMFPKLFRLADFVFFKNLQNSYLRLFAKQNIQICGSVQSDVYISKFSVLAAWLCIKCALAIQAVFLTRNKVWQCIRLVPVQALVCVSHARVHFKQQYSCWTIKAEKSIVVHCMHRNRCV